VAITLGHFQYPATSSLAAKAKLVVDYKRPDSIVVSLDSTVGIKLSADDSLVLSGGLTQDLVNGEVKGRVSAHLRIAKDLSAELEQRFGASGPVTSFELRLKL
jgi:hypothetical protein